jgi:hypothetical protein
MKVEFSREVIVVKQESVTVDVFMKHYFSEAHLFGTELDIYVRSAIRDGFITKVMAIKLLPEELTLDFDDTVNVETVIKRYLTDTNIPV